MSKPAANRETEMKLSAPADDLEKLWSALLARTSAKPGKLKLTNRYFDTPDGRLGALRMSLRVREKNGQFLQTLKSAPEEGGFARGEWECPLPAPAKKAPLPTPDLSLITDEEALALLDGIGLDVLAPVFTTRFERAALLIEQGEGDGRVVIEAARDIGKITAPTGAEEPIREIELELVEGPVTALHDLALDLLVVAPFRVGSASKAERGQKLAAKSDAGATLLLPAVAARNLPDLLPDQDVEDGFARIILSCLGHLRANEDGAIEAESVCLRQMQIALRRLRTAFSLFKPMLPEERADFFQQEARWYAGNLRPARDWDMFQTELLPPIRRALAEGTPDQQKLATDLDALADLAAEQQRHAYAEVRETISSPRATEFLLRLTRWVESQGWRDPSPGEKARQMQGTLADIIPARLRRLEKKALKAGQDLPDLDSEQRHKLRLVLKKLRYATGFFTPLLTGKNARSNARNLARLQKSLGQLNDQATASRLLHQLAEDEALVEPHLACAAGVVLGWYAHSQPETETKLLDRWDDFAGEKGRWRLRG